MDSKELLNLQEAYLEIVMNEAKKPLPVKKMRKKIEDIKSSMKSTIEKSANEMGMNPKRVRFPFSPDDREKYLKYEKRVNDISKSINKEQVDLYDIILSHLLDEGYAETPEAAEAMMVNISEEWREYIMEREDSEYERASDAALDARYGYGRATGDKRSFGRAANRASAAALLRRLRRDRDQGRTTSRESGADAVHQGWAHTARTSEDQTPEKKARRAKLADTSYSKLPEDEKEKDRVSADAVRAIYNRNTNR